MQMNKENILKNNKNKGFTLVELIVVIAIMVILTGMLVPQFMKYVASNREKACMQNREAILNVFEKGVYAMNYKLETDMMTNNDLTRLVNDAFINGDEYSVQARDYLTCPSDNGTGHFTAMLSKDGTKAYISCDEHGDVCVVDFTGWVDQNNENKLDPGYIVPTPGVTPPEVHITPPPTPGVTEPVKTVNTGVWPYLADDEGNLDERWETAKDDSGNIVGPVPGAYVDIPLYEKSHFIADKSGDEYVIVKSNATDAAGKPVYRVKYEWAMGPDEIDRLNWDTVILVSGRKYDDQDNKPPYMNDTTTTQYIVAMGDQVTMHFDDGQVVTYIYGSFNDSGWVSLPQKGDYAYGTSYNNWYRVSDLYTGN